MADIIAVRDLPEAQTAPNSAELEKVVASASLICRKYFQNYVCRIYLEIY